MYSDTWVRLTVAKRTAKTVTTPDGMLLRISLYEGVEQVKPYGSYSMCPIIGADDEGRGAKVEEEEEEEETTKVEPTCKEGGNRHVFLGGYRCTLCHYASNIF